MNLITSSEKVVLWFYNLIIGNLPNIFISKQMYLAEKVIICAKVAGIGTGSDKIINC